MSTEPRQGLPLIQQRRTHDGERAQEVVSVIRENGRSFACTADTREEAWAGLVRLMARCMDAHAEQTGLDPGDALTREAK